MRSEWADDLTLLPPGAHLCRVYSDDRDLAQGAATFVGGGLAAGHRVLYIAGDRHPDQVEASLTVHGVGANRARATGQLIIRTSRDVYGDRLPELDDLEAGFRAAHEQARADGLPGLRVAAEMGDAAARFGSLKNLLRWEAAATMLQLETGISSVCQYECRNVTEQAQRLLTAVHAGTAPLGCPPPLAGFYFESSGLRVVGEVDISNCAQFLGFVEARLDVQQRLDLDVTELAFVDVQTLVSLFEIVRGRPAVELTLRNPTVRLQRLLSLAGLQHPRVRVG